MSCSECNYARKNAGREGSACHRSCCRMVCFLETAGKANPRTFGVEFVLASSTRPTPDALSMGPVHIAVGTELKNALSSWYSVLRGPGSSVGIATELRAGRSGIESWWGRDFLPVQTGPGAHPASSKMGTGSFPGV